MAAKRREAVFGIVEGLDQLLAADHLVHQRGLLASQHALLLEQPERTAGDKPGDQKAQRGQDHDQQRDGEIFREHEHQRDGDGQAPRQQLGKAQQQAVTDDIDIRRDAADQVTDGVTVQVRERKLLQVADALLPQGLDCPIGDAVVDAVRDPIAHGGQRHQNADFLQIMGEAGKMDLTCPGNLVDGVAKENGDIQLQHDGGGGQQGADHQSRPGAADAPQQLGQAGPLGRAFERSFSYGASLLAAALRPA